MERARRRSPGHPRDITGPALEDELHALIKADPDDCFPEERPGRGATRHRLEPGASSERPPADNEVAERLRCRLDPVREGLELEGVLRVELHPLDPPYVALRQLLGVRRVDADPERKGMEAPARVD
jgi:hypothetical protein